MSSLLLLSFLVLTVPTESGTSPKDSRLGALRGEQGDFLLKPATSRKHADARSEQVRRIMQVTMGLWPLPERTPLQAVVHGRMDLGEFTVEKVYFQSVPGFYVTGSLYRPKGRPGRRAAVLSPHGHFPGGRFQDEGLQTVRKKIEQGAERFEDGGRSFMQSRCVQLARMGCVVFHYDMVGYADNEQLSLDLAHKFSRSRGQFDQPPESGFYSASALLNLNNQLGLHTWNSIRALDFLTSLPDVDSNRIAVTGGSGGGTQTFMLCALDDRPRVSVPVVIVSADRQGGCTCENICGFRIDTHNLDFTALHAPKPMLLISADDATRTMATRGFPELERHYGAYAAHANVEHVSLTQFPHNYNYVSRAAMYEFLNRHLKLGVEKPIEEGPYQRLSEKELSVWNEDHPSPPPTPEFEQQLLDTINTAARKQLLALTPRDAPSLAEYRNVVGGAWDVLLRKLPPTHDVRFKEESVAKTKQLSVSRGRLSYQTLDQHTAQLPVVTLTPQRPAKRTVIWITPSGKSGLFDMESVPTAAVQTLLAAGRRVIGVDLLYQGELGDKQKPLVRRQRTLPGEQGFGGWTYCYNLPLFAHRVHDILAVIELIGQEDKSQAIDIIGLGEAGPLVAAALVQSQTIDRAVVGTGGFRFSQLTDVYDARFLPGAAKYGDVPGLLSLVNSDSLWLAGESLAADSIVKSAWRSRENPDRLTVYQGSDTERDALQWLLK